MTPSCPFILFEDWYKKAETAEINDPNAATLSTVDEYGRPSSRIILVKASNGEGFTFFTNYTSTKAQHLIQSPFASLCFHWKSLRLQIRIEGTVSKTTPKTSDAYFATRSRESRIGAHASLQSQDLEKREDLEKRFAGLTNQFSNIDVPRPDHWGGFLLMPNRIEFWEDRPHRLHHRIIYDKCHSTNWIMRLVYP